jgi:hypothetical protein
MGREHTTGTIYLDNLVHFPNNTHGSVVALLHHDVSVPLLQGSRIPW